MHLDRIWLWLQYFLYSTSYTLFLLNTEFGANTLPGTHFLHRLLLLFVNISYTWTLVTRQQSIQDCFEISTTIGINTNHFALILGGLCRQRQKTTVFFTKISQEHYLGNIVLGHFTLLCSEFLWDGKYLPTSVSTKYYTNQESIENRS